jgi:hypothetical protein
MLEGRSVLVVIADIGSTRKSSYCPTEIPKTRNSKLSQ